MTTFSVEQLRTLTEPELRVLLHAASARLAVFAEAAVVAAATATLQRLGVVGVSRIEVGAGELEDGYFWSGISKVEDTAGTVRLDQLVLDELEAALDAPLTRLAYDHSNIGRRSKLTIDLVTHTVYT